MVKSLASIAWQETVDLAVARLEAHTGLPLAGLNQLEINFQVREWMKAKDQAKLISPRISQEIEKEDLKSFIMDAAEHLAEPGTPGD
jgi:hypothetical protein